MTTLRIRLAAPPAPERADAWALYDASGALRDTGTDRPDAWPKADRIEYVLAASQVRIASVALPPMSPSRLAGAVGFALEDQLAGPVSAHQLAVSPQADDGRVRVAIMARARLAELTARYPASRIIAESDLAEPVAGWRWCARDERTPGFVLREDGSAFPVDAPAVDGALPAEIAVALAQARRDHGAPQSIRVDAPIGDTALSRMQREASVPLHRGTPWRWEDAGPERHARAIDLAPAADASTAKAPRHGIARLFVPALALACAAAAIHVVAAVVEWTSLRVDAWRSARDWQSLAVTAGVPPESAATPQSARSAIAKRYAEVRHARGLPAAGDALPLLARAAPALASLPPASVRSAIYADGHWTVEVNRSDAIGELEARMRRDGVPILVAASQSGVRIRFGDAW